MRAARRILVANPNTSDLVTARLAAAARALAGPGIAVEARSAPFGAPALLTDADLRVAADAVAQMVAERGDADAVLVAAFGDPGLAAARAAAGCPVAGLGEAGFRECAEAGDFVILTLGPRMEQNLRAAVARAGVADRLRDIRFLEADLLAFAADPMAWDDAIRAHVDRAADEGAAALLLGGGPFAGLERDFASDRIAVRDSLGCAMRALIAALD